jgi:outer membrane protein assembly factor BamB
VLLTNRLVYAAVIGTTPYETRHLGSLTALDPKTGRIVWRWPMPEWPGALLNGFVASPVIQDRMLVIGGLDGTAVRVATSAPSRPGLSPGPASSSPDLSFTN